MVTVAAVKRLVIGQPVPTQPSGHEGMPKRVALPVFGADGLSSTAYATQENLIKLAVMGTAAFFYSIYISIAIAILLLIVALSYRQTIKAYPNGGGAYIVARENINEFWGLVAGAALIIAYILTVAVSIAAGVEAAYSAIPALEPWRVELALGILALLHIMNVRGMKESGPIVAGLTYFFLAGLSIMVVYGLLQLATGQLGKVEHLEGPLMGPHGAVTTFATMSLFLLASAFAAGCTALTGVEAISNGVPGFNNDHIHTSSKPEPRTRLGRFVNAWLSSIAKSRFVSKVTSTQLMRFFNKKRDQIGNAQFVLGALVAFLGVLFIGITILAVAVGAEPRALPNGLLAETIPAQIARTVFGGKNVWFYMIQSGTILILLLGSNTPFAGCPYLTYNMAKDGYLPHQFTAVGDKLVYTNGVNVVTFFAGILIYMFNASATALLPMYAIGVFISFTLSQGGMVFRWFGLRNEIPRWYLSAALNFVGACATAFVFAILGWTRFTEGAWIVVVAYAVIMPAFYFIKHHYDLVRRGLSLKRHLGAIARNIPDNCIYVTQSPECAIARSIDCRHMAVVTIGGYNYVEHLGLMAAHGQYDGCIIAVHVDVDPVETQRVIKRWAKWAPDGVQLTIVPSPYRYMAEPLIEFLEQISNEVHPLTLAVVMPIFVLSKWWEFLLHNQTALSLRRALHLSGVANLSVSTTPYNLDALLAEAVDTITLTIESEQESAV